MRTELMVAVERAVRPIRAGGARKLRMRQELLAHLTASYEEEKARLGDDRAAAEAAVRRFGDSREITRDLQASVPVLERVLCAPIPGTGWTRATDAAGIRFLQRLDRPALVASAWALLTVACNVPLAWVRFRAGPQDSAEAWVAAGSLGALAVLSFAFMACFCRMCLALSDAVDWRRAAFYGVLASAFLIATVPPSVRLLLGPEELTLERLSRAAVTAILVVIGMAWVARHFARQRGWANEWARLEVGQ